MTKALCLFSLCGILAFSCFAQAVLPANGLLTPEESLAFIQGLARRQLYDECLSQADAFLTSYPEHAYAESVQASRIQALFALERYPEAADAIRSHLAKYPKTKIQGELLWRLGECLRNTQDYANALPVYEKLLADAKGVRAEEARYRLAICLEKLGRSSEAREYLQQLAELPPDAEHLPRVYARQYLAVLKRGGGDCAGALAMYQPLLTLKGLPAELRQTLLLTAASLSSEPSLQDYAQAVRHYGAFLVEFPRHPGADTVRRNLLSCHYALKHDAEFLALYQEYAKVHPGAEKDDELNWLLAKTYMRCQHYSDALVLLQKQDSDEALAPAVRQRALKGIIDCQKALALDEELVQNALRYRELYPSSPELNDVLLAQAASNQRLGRTGDAIQNLQELFPRLAGGEPLVYQQIGCSLAALQTDAGSYADAASLYLELAEKAPGEPLPPGFLSRKTLLLNALSALYSLPEDPRGLQLTARLLESAEQQEEKLQFLHYRYQFALQAKNYPVALETIQQLLSLEPPEKQPLWLESRAQLHRTTGAYDDAANDYQEILFHPHATAEEKNKILPDLVMLLYFQKRFTEAAPLLPALFEIQPHPPLSEQLLLRIARERTLAEDFTNARKAYQRILENPQLAPEMQECHLFLLAEVEFQDGKADQAKTLLEQAIRSREQRGLAAASDSSALMAEVMLREHQPDAALVFARQTLAGKDRTISPDTLPRARWAMAQALLELGDAKGAFSAATQGFILFRNAVYSPRCYQVAATAKEAMGDSKTAQELRQSCKKVFPEF